MGEHSPPLSKMGDIPPFPIPVDGHGLTSRLTNDNNGLLMSFPNYEMLGTLWRITLNKCDTTKTWLQLF